MQETIFNSKGIYWVLELEHLEKGRSSAQSVKCLNDAIEVADLFILALFCLSVNADHGYGHKVDLCQHESVPHTSSFMTSERFKKKNPLPITNE